MTSQQRVLAALNHRQPDRVPIDLSGHRSSGISAILYPRLRKLLGLPPVPVRVYDPIQQLAVVDGDVLERFGVDTVELGRGFAFEESWWAPWTLPDGSPCLMPSWALPEREDGRWVIRSESGRILAHMPDGALYFEQVFYPRFEDPGMSLPDALRENMWTGVASPPGPEVAGSDGREKLAQGARRLRSSTDRAVIGLFGGNLIETGEFVYRMDNFLSMLAGEPREAHRFLDALTEHHLASLESFLGSVGAHIDVVLFGDDLGMQTGPLISPQMYREFFKPRHGRMWRRAKELAPVKVMLHCCGGIRQLIPDLIEAGLDAVNPVQTSCEGMDPRELKREFGRELVFWGGGCDTQDVLPNASPEEVRRHVRERVEIWNPGGGFVFQQVHNILANVPPENVVAMLEAAAA
ncbi:MAG: methyltransferase [Spirochaetales bacterium]|nr:methyltransferase [Spirochaetales bacterium]